MTRTYDDYHKLIIEGKSLEDVVLIARSDYSVPLNLNIKESDNYRGQEIPFNLERMYVDQFINKKEYDKAEKILHRMRCSYPDSWYQNFIEVYEYHLKSIVQSENAIKDSIIEAKKEFNQHTVTLVSIIVGVITIFGSANTIFVEHSYEEMFRTFITVVISIIAVIWIVTALNNGSSKK